MPFDEAGHRSVAVAGHDRRNLYYPSDARQTCYKFQHNFLTFGLMPDRRVKCSRIAACSTLHYRCATYARATIAPCAEGGDETHDSVSPADRSAGNRGPARRARRLNPTP